LEFVVQREACTAESTQGELLINGEHFSWSLEPRKDQTQGKPYCIPAGTYQVELLQSARFDMITPHLLNVPGFTEVEIHPGNYPRDTTACTLIGYLKATNFVGDSRKCFEDFMSKLLSGFEITYLDAGGTA